MKYLQIEAQNPRILVSVTVFRISILLSLLQAPLATSKEVCADFCQSVLNKLPGLVAHLKQTESLQASS